MTEFRVRKATLDDLSVLVQLFDAYRVFYEQASDPARAKEFLQQRLHGQDSVILLAEDASGQAAGFVQMFPSFSSVSAARIWILNDLFVSPTHRKRGVGRALLGAAEQFGLDDGAHCLKLETHRTNTVAQALYVEQGWEEDREFCTYYFPLHPSEAQP
ncbi:GNAT family N-acetyltransferase [Pseudoxanthomonas sp. CAU 1598]|uniref:GNAT family N-acetyltransferase n=2 Tax=Pseudomarimonas arenosa TaxID=2774145 RepID=A0AAW3ZMJ8_9GAMM|nr:GNAT family N-acetyltransferase [Pseudomarimonas arenosa]